MKTKNLILLPYWIYTESLDVAWYKSDQMRWYEELKNGKYHGDSKRWRGDGLLLWYSIYKNGELVKEIV